MPEKSNLGKLGILAFVLVIGFFLYLYVTNNRTVDFCYNTALLGSVQQVKFRAVSDTKKREIMQDEVAESIFRDCLNSNGAQWPESFTVLREIKK